MSDSAKPAPELFRCKGHLPEAIHLYRAEAGEPVAVAARFPPGTLNPGKKEFRLYRFEAGSWLLGTRAQKLPLYNLPEVRAQVRAGELLFVVEGEKCADRLTDLGLVATTNACGAGKWDVAHTEVLRGATVALLPDNDAPGLEHMQAVARALRSAAQSLRVVELPCLPARGDVADWLDSGGTREALLNMVESAPEWAPCDTPGQEWQDPLPFGVESDSQLFSVAEALPSHLAEFAQGVANTVRVDPVAPAVLIPPVLSCAACHGPGYLVHLQTA